MIKQLLPILISVFLLACAGLPDNTTPPSTAMPNSGSSYLSLESTKQHQILGLTKDDALMTLLPHGVDSFAARIALIDAAEESLDLQYYLFHYDLSGGLIIAALWRAAERGVRIRVLIDDIDLEEGMNILLDSTPIITLKCEFLTLFCAVKAELVNI